MQWSESLMLASDSACVYSFCMGYYREETQEAFCPRRYGTRILLMSAVDGTGSSPAMVLDFPVFMCGVCPDNCHPDRGG
jgi:hypothetical protein